MLINELDMIEKELDAIFKGQGTKQNKYIKDALEKNGNEVPSREKVFRQAVDLNKEITSLQSEL